MKTRAIREGLVDGQPYVKKDVTVVYSTDGWHTALTAKAACSNGFSHEHDWTSAP